MDTHLETLAAWVDAEPVQHGDVMRALETAEGLSLIHISEPTRPY